MREAFTYVTPCVIDPYSSHLTWNSGWEMQPVQRPKETETVMN